MEAIPDNFVDCVPAYVSIDGVRSRVRARPPAEPTGVNWGYAGATGEVSDSAYSIP
jgi:hypothetical protein